jgi:drug/metabolite transporter (DMT)-like permease
LLTVLIWSLNFSAVKVGVETIAPLAFSAVRFVLGASVTVAVVLAREGLPRFHRHDLGLLLAAALCGITINQVAFVGALSITSAANVALLMGTIPIWTALIVLATPRSGSTRRTGWPWWPASAGWRSSCSVGRTRGWARSASAARRWRWRPRRAEPPTPSSSARSWRATRR